MREQALERSTKPAKEACKGTADSEELAKECSAATMTKQPGKIIAYTREGCAESVRLKQTLKRLSPEVLEICLSRYPSRIAELQRLNIGPTPCIPCVVFNDQVIGVSLPLNSNLLLAVFSLLSGLFPRSILSCLGARSLIRVQVTHLHLRWCIAAATFQRTIVVYCFESRRSLSHFLGVHLAISSLSFAPISSAHMIILLCMPP